MERTPSTGASFLEEVVYGVIPQVFPLWISYSLYRFESNVRSATVEMCIRDRVVGAATLGGVLQAIRWGWEPWLAPGIGVLSDRRFGRQSMMVVSLAFGVVVFGLVALSLPLPLWLLALIGIQLTGTSLTTIADSVASDTASVRGGRVFMMLSLIHI